MCFCDRIEAFVYLFVCTWIDLMVIPWNLCFACFSFCFLLRYSSVLRMSSTTNEQRSGGRGREREGGRGGGGGRGGRGPPGR